MEVDGKERLARTGDITKEAAGFRLRCARISLSLSPEISQKEMARRVGVPHTTYGNWEVGSNYPGMPAMLYLYRTHRIDFNFILYGDFAGLPMSLQDSLFAALEREQIKVDRKP